MKVAKIDISFLIICEDIYKYNSNIWFFLSLY